MAEPANPFDLSALSFKQFGPMLESVERFNKTWSSLSGIPSRMLPTVNVEELDQRINELKAVEQWLTLNLNVLRNTIQGMGMQRDTLSAVQAFGASLSDPPAEGVQPPASPWAKAAEAFKAFAEPGAGHATPEGSTPPPAAPFAGFGNPFEAWRPKDDGAAGAPSPEAGPGMPPSLNPSVWWAMLQQHFTQVADTALASTPRSSRPDEASPEEEPELPADMAPATSAHAPEEASDPPDTPASTAAPRTETPWSTRGTKPVPPLVRPSRNAPRNSR